MEKILIVDGNNLLFQMFYGMPSKIYNKSNKTIHATIGFISAIQRLINLIEATKVIVVFDKDPSNEKKELYKDYKANRTINWDQLKEDEVPFNEEGYICSCLSFLDTLNLILYIFFLSDNKENLNEVFFHLFP